MEQKELSFEELMKLITSNKATALQKIKFSQLLSQQAQQEAQEEKQAIVQKIDDFILKSGISVDEYVKLKKPAPSNEIIFEWTDEQGKTHIKIKGSKGKWSSKETVIKNLTLEKALSFAKSDDGKSFVRKLYETK